MSGECCSEFYCHCSLQNGNPSFQCEDGKGFCAKVSACVDNCSELADNKCCLEFTTTTTTRTTTTRGHCEFACHQEDSRNVTWDAEPHQVIYKKCGDDSEGEKVSALL